MQASGDEILFFIPDLGGFTRFVAETEIRHSQHIVKELLELLADANTLGMKVSEFEGDAVLFYRQGVPPSLGELVQQARTMYLALHTHLKRFESRRVCQCGACAGAIGITLKMVAHFGVAGAMQVKNHQKFLGKDIIIAHRLLKNSVRVPEYLLVTGATLTRLGPAQAELDAFEPGVDAYDNLGSIEYRVKSLQGYLDEIKLDPPVSGKFDNPRRVGRVTRRIDAPVERVYQWLIDLPGRMHWIDGITRIEMPDAQPNHIGKTHRCVRGNEGSEVMTTEVKVSESSMELWETDLRKLSACRYLLVRAPGNRTDLSVELFVRDNLIVRLVFRVLMARKLITLFEKSTANLARLCERPDGG